MPEPSRVRSRGRRAWSMRSLRLSSHLANRRGRGLRKAGPIGVGSRRGQRAQARAGSARLRKLVRQVRRGGAQGRGRRGRGGSEVDRREKLRLEDFRTLLTNYYLGWKLNQSTRTTCFLPCKPSYIPVLSRNQPGAPNTVDTHTHTDTLLLDFRTVETYNSFVCTLCVVISGHCNWERIKKKVFCFVFVSFKSRFIFVALAVQELTL